MRRETAETHTRAPLIQQVAGRGGRGLAMLVLTDLGSVSQGFTNQYRVRPFKLVNLYGL